VFVLKCCAALKANTPNTYALLNNVLKDVKISIFIDYAVSAQHVLLISIPVLKETSKEIKGFKTTSSNRYQPNICVEYSRGVL